MGSVLSVESVVVRYGTTVAVNGVSFEVAPGEIVALLGPSGSGKSSLLRAVAGLEPVVSGDVVWGGRSIVDVPTFRRGFGLMFQDGQLFPHRDVAGNVAFGLRSLSRVERRVRVAEALDLVGMGAFAKRSVSSLSGGQAQRVALARSLAPLPELLLLDEPLSALDRSLRERLSVEIRQILRGCGASCIYVTHDQDEAFTVADRVGVMIEGRLVALAAPHELWRDPGQRVVAEFLGFGPFVSDSSGHMRALTPGAAHVVELVEDSAVPSGVFSGDVSSFVGDFLHFVGQVTDVRGGRGFSVVHVLLSDQVVRAHADSSWGDVRHLQGSCVRVSVDLTRCPVVFD